MQTNQQIRTTLIRTIFLPLLLLISFSPVKGQQGDSPGQTENITIDSRILGEKRKIRIKLPSRYNQFDSYPVVYLLDGEAFTTLVAGEVQYLSETYKIIPDIIIVGIENTDRMRDLTPTHPLEDADGKPDTSATSPFRNTGGGEKFLSFIKQELMPYVQARYHTAPYKILAGHSLGGLIAIYCLLEHPAYFNSYIAISPSLQWDAQNLLKQAAAKLKYGDQKNNLLFFSDANEDAAFHSNQLILDSILQERKVVKYKRSFYPEETHISEPVKAFYDGLRFIYPAWHLPYNSSAFRKTLNSKIIIDHYKELSQIYHYTVVPSHDDIILISRFLRNDPAKISGAIELLEQATANYPSSVMILETLGDTYSRAGNKTAAADNFTKALKLDPHNSNISKKLKTLSK